jgi:hypothetical protein
MHESQILLNFAGYSEKFFIQTIILYVMLKFLVCKELYELIQQKSLETKEILWVCSPNLGLDAHEVFSMEILKSLPADIRFVFNATDFAIRSGNVNPYELQYFMEHFSGDNVKSHDNFSSNIYIFDNSALITSANLKKPSFENSVETGVLLDGPEVDEIKSFFSSLWENAKTIRELQKLKKMWKVEKSWNTGDSKKTKPHTQIKNWADDYVSRWYFTIPDLLSKNVERKIKKETNWASDLSVVADIGPTCFKNIKLGDLAFLACMKKKRGKVEVDLVRIFDKGIVETDEGDHHFAYRIEKVYLLERKRFYEMLINATIGPKTWGAQLSENQVKWMNETLYSRKTKKLSKSKIK